LDRKIITSWNGLAISALCHGYAVLGDGQYLEAAEKAADFLWQVHHRKGGRLFRASNGGQPVHEAVLDDYALLAIGFLDLFQVTGQKRHLKRVLDLVHFAQKEFSHEEGGFYLTAASSKVPLGRKVDLFDSVIPSGNSAMLHALIRIAALTGDQEYRQQVQAALEAYGPILQRAQLEMAWWLDAAEMFNGPFFEIIIAGDTEKRGALTAAVLRTLPAHAVVAMVPAEGPDQELASLLRPAAGKTAAEGRAVAYVCEFGLCRRPTSDPAEVLAQISVASAVTD
jgi:uncharacterized protein YyaL (SSP411 family)